MMRRLYCVKVKSKQQGFAALFICLAILLITTLMLVYTAYVVVNQQKLVTIVYNNMQAQQAAEAGIEYGQAYFKQNSSTILAGTFPTTVMTGTVTNSLGQTVSYSVNYTKPYPTTNPSVVMINATGRSTDSSSTNSMSKLYYVGSGLSSLLKYSVVSQRSVTISGNGSVTNLDYNNTIDAGGGVSLSGNAHTTTTSGGSSAHGSIGTDITQNDTAISGLSSASLFSSVFNKTQSQMQSSANTVLNGSTTLARANQSAQYAGQVVWVNGNARISGNGSVGTAANPVVLIVNGNFTVSGNGQFYGLVYVANTVVNGNTIVSSVTYSGNAGVVGGTVAEGTVTISGNGGSHSSSVISLLGVGSGVSGAVPGTWADF